ncbi:MAG: patatin-like phospholipase family protein [Deltaproteobacteria bacterium]|nr:patatin-like phospholipase family protein [Deltaproteobacteria bacterium]
MTHRRSLAEHLDPKAGPKRLLALDGGGIRGIFTLQYLKRLETMLRERHGDPNLLLCDYFDLIGGTSTGSIIAAGLAIGKDVDFLINQYESLGYDIFKDETWWEELRSLPLPSLGGGAFRAALKESLARLVSPVKGVFAPKFPKGPLEDELARHFRIPLGSDGLRTGLMIVSRRADTGSPWAMHNNPRGKYYDWPEGTTPNWIPNKDYLVSDLIAASAAAPTYFKPEEITVGIKPDGSPKVGVFVDGGISPFNNPALQLLMLATQSGYRFDWPMGEDNLLLVSVGTAFRPKLMTSSAGLPIKHAVTNLTALMDDCDSLNRTILQWLAHSPNSVAIDSEIGDLAPDRVGGKKHLTYLRYNVTLQERWMKEELAIEKDDSYWEALSHMDQPDNLEVLANLGQTAATSQLRPEHFPAHFDLAAPG